MSSRRQTGPTASTEAPYGRITPYVIISCIMAASGGLMYGYNIGISGGITSMDDFITRFFPSIYSKMQMQASSHLRNSQYCKFNSQALQAFTSTLYIAGLASTLAASYTTSMFGRKPTMILAGALFVLGVILTGAAQNLVMLILGRIILGFGTGFANQAGPIYLSEVAPARLRGGLNIMFQLNITIGILLANLVNYGTSKIRRWGWRISLSVAGIPAAFLTLGAMVMVETPNSLIEHGHLEEGKSVLSKIRGGEDVAKEFEGLVNASEMIKHVEHPFTNMLKKRNSPQLIISILMQIFQQFTGMNAIMFYAPALFQALGFESSASLYSAVITGAVNVLSTIVSLVTVDRFGRRILLLEAGIQMFISQVVVAILLGARLQGNDHVSHASAIVIVTMICAFVAAFAWSWGPMGWLIPSEIFPPETRSAGLSIAVFVNLLTTFVIAQGFLSMLCALEYGIFVFFSAWVLLMTTFVFLFLPETKNIPMDSMNNIWKNHWFWKRVVPKDTRNNMNFEASAKGDFELGDPNTNESHVLES